MGFLNAIPAFIYTIAVRIRHWLYDAGIIKSRRYDIPVVCVGNITVGGTGKTPVTEYLLGKLAHNYKVAVLSRGYGRKSKGYIEVQTTSSFLKVGDEPKQIKRKFPDTVVVVCENRREGIERIKREHPEVNLIVMDDGFQHRRVDPRVNIVLMDYTRPVYRDHMLPWGSLRDLPSQIQRANIVIVTKTPPGMQPIERRLVVKSLGLFPYQSVFFTSMENGALRPAFPEAVGEPGPVTGVVVMAGIGNPKALVNTLKEKYPVPDTFLFRDHHIYKVGQLKKITEKVLAMPEGTIIVTTEKDGVKLTNSKKVPEQMQRRLYILPVELNFPERDEDKFMKTLYKNVKEN